MLFIVSFVILLVLAFASQQDYQRFLKKGSTGDLSKVIRGVLFFGCYFIANIEIQVWWQSAGFVIFLIWWIWDTFCSYLWYRNFYTIGNTKLTDRIFNRFNHLFVWWAKAFMVMFFLSFYLNKVYL